MKTLKKTLLVTGIATVIATVIVYKVIGDPLDFKLIIDIALTAFLTYVLKEPIESVVERFL